MSVDVDLPNPWTFNANFSGALDLDLDEIRIKELPPVEFRVSELSDFNFRVKELPVIVLKADIGIKELPIIRLESNSKLDVKLDSTSKLESTSKLDTTSKLESNSKVDLGLDNIRIRELPTLKFELGFKPVRFHFPINYQWRLTLFGYELFKFNTCGESQVIAEDYVARSTESCS